MSYQSGSIAAHPSISLLARPIMLPVYGPVFCTTSSRQCDGATPAPAEYVFTPGLLPALQWCRPAAGSPECRRVTAAGRSGRDGAWSPVQAPGAQGRCRGQGHGGKHQEPSATARWALLHSNTLAVASLGERKALLGEWSWCRSRRQCCGMPQGAGWLREYEALVAA